MTARLRTALVGARTMVKHNRPLRGALFLGQNVVHGCLARPAGSGPAAPAASGPGVTPRYELAAMIRVKDEARFLPEWLAHHVALGVEHVVVYDNASRDGTREAIEPFVAEGLVTYVHWPAVPVSPGSHLDFLARFGPTCRWAAFLDADEFVVEAEPGALRAALDAARDRPALALNERYFGSAGHETIPAGLVTERFDRASAEITDHVKVIAQPAAVARYRNPHNFYYRRGRLARTPDGRRVFGSFVTPAAEPSLVIHHYVYRSREDYERKARPSHGYATAVGARERARRLERAEAEFHRHNDVTVTVPEAARRATADLLRRLGYPEELYRHGRPVTSRRPATTRDPGP
ncbi:MAG TPA: glycosyltransferase family 2 protein [Acidimicrobiales bacterium]